MKPKFSDLLKKEQEKQRKNPHNPSDIQNTSMTNIDCGLDSGLVKLLIYDSNRPLQLIGFSRQKQYQINGTWNRNYPLIKKDLQDYRIVINGVENYPYNNPIGAILTLRSPNPQVLLNKVCNMLHQEYNRPPHGAVF
tara:strand:+ start:465 stop:875 length:411 start_codon:yes stop_codon:yes gene_type:complete